MVDAAKSARTPVELSKPQKAAAVAMGAFLMGALWRFRGEHGYGASWGLLTCGMVFLLLVFAVFGFRRKAGFLLYSLTAAAFMLSTPGWGTLNGQITGILESGVAGLVATSWNGLAEQAGTPAAVVNRLNKDIVAAVNAPDVKAKLHALNVEAQSSSPEQAASLLASETRRWGDIITRAKIPTQ